MELPAKELSQLDRLTEDHRNDLKGRVLEFLIPILVCFTVYRCVAGPLFMALVGLAATFTLVKDLSTYRKRGVFWLPQDTLIVLLALGECFSIKAGGVVGIFWVYPTILVAFWTLERTLATRAIVVSCCLWITTIWLLFPTDIVVRASFSIIPTCFLARRVARILDLQREHLNTLITVDPLTGAFNRRRLAESLQDRLLVLERYNRPTSIVSLDIDLFKSVNDDFGHDMGDKVLSGVSEIVKKRIRATDSFFRVGGEEFLVVLPETDLEGAKILAEHLRWLVERSSLLVERPVTVSLGVTTSLKNEQLQSWLKRCDQALYRAKQEGRNRVCWA